MQHRDNQRQFLTDLIALARSSATRTAQSHEHFEAAVMTLHILFPTLVLPALDLLDRSFVARARMIDDFDQDADTGPDFRDDCAIDQQAHPALYYVHCLASSPKKRRGRVQACLLAPHLVHINAWSCSCTKFAVESFDGHVLPVKNRRPSPAQSFGGMMPLSSLPLLATAAEAGSGQKLPAIGGAYVTAPYRVEQNLPCCEHLLACVLAEAWPDLLKNEAVDRDITSLEMAAVASSN
ncbi:hypothetical protein CDD80_4894 [Ophiocordyceps camponoti-rufipedis]|uniref:SWIM-type domain-containing protein n=1 Tax=Ophiocordyceps camponoti-rufipedis TaxID=2004952 RepID=A0A2C5YW04_9HYPO|nr:hypothetical protein CDD80_4894 [Ophiocordyceps camponoti-rufipedis]